MSERANRLISVFADESCVGNGREGENPGGAGALVEYLDAGTIVRHDCWTSLPATTNNRMALTSVCEVMRSIGARKKTFDIVFTSDSQYLIRGMTEWVHGWAVRGWRRKGGGIENLDLWREAIALVRDGGHRVMWKWVRGHAGHAQNVYADRLATRAAAAQTKSDGLVPSEFDLWHSDQLLARKAISEPEPFPLRDNFIPSRTLPTPPSASQLGAPSFFAD